MNWIIAITLIVLLHAILAHDLVALSFQGWTGTIAHAVQEWMREFPALNLSTGFIAGGLFWPRSK